MSITYLTEVYEIIRAENLLIPSLALNILRYERAGELDAAHEGRAKFQANYGDKETHKLDTCLLYFRMYGVPQEVQDAAQR